MRPITMLTITITVFANCDRYMNSVQFFEFLNNPRGLGALSEKLIGTKRVPVKSITVSNDAVGSERRTVREFSVSVVGVKEDEDFVGFLTRMSRLLSQDGCTVEAHYHPLEIAMSGTDEYWREQPDIFI